MQEEIRIAIGRFLYPVKVKYTEDRVYFSFDYNKKLIELFKKMGCRWSPVTKSWTIANTQRVSFRLQHIKRGVVSPFQRYDKELEPYVQVRKYIKRSNGKEYEAFGHQKEMIRHVWTRRHCIIAGEMGVGKTRAMIEVMERAMMEYGWAEDDILYVSNKSGLAATRDDLYVWQCNFRPNLVTYNKMVKLAEEWNDGWPAPKMLVLDESSAVKNHTTKRSQAAQHIADAIRAEHGEEGIIVLMSGTCAPKDPCDWWSQAEIARPGFLIEGNVKALKYRLAIMKKIEDIATGVSYPKLLGWRDNADRCNECGQLKGEKIHDMSIDPDDEFGVMNDVNAHPFKESINEVDLLHKRLKGLVTVHLKKDNMDLPERLFKIIRVKPSQKILNAAKIIVKKSSNTLKATTLLRELSDGFQYHDETVGFETCEICSGSGRVEAYFDPEKPWEPLDQLKLVNYEKLEKRLDLCPGCDGSKKQKITKRATKRVSCPKDDVVRDILKEVDDIGRAVVFAGMRGSVDRCVDVTRDAGWNVIRIDGRGWQWHGTGTYTQEQMYEMFKYRKKFPQKICVVANQAAGSKGLNFAASPVIIVYSNNNSGEDRMQCLERNNRPGEDDYKSIIVYDIVHLPTDLEILKAHKRKQKLQAMSLGVFAQALEGDTYEDR